MKLTTGILAVVMITGAAWGQNPASTGNPRSDAKSLPQTKPRPTTRNPCWWRKRPSQHRELWRRL